MAAQTDLEAEREKRTEAERVTARYAQENKSMNDQIIKLQEQVRGLVGAAIKMINSSEYCAFDDACHDCRRTHGSHDEDCSWIVLHDALAGLGE